ncbi:MAG: hypothetical protein LBG10_09660 [Treponema sp.]|jgi:hypothetical protein|nr:hypothetical protein [Treponema sp.]
MSSNGRGGNNRRKSSRRRDQFSPGSGKNDGHHSRHINRDNDSRQDAARPGEARRFGESVRFDKNRGNLYDRPRWTPPKTPSGPLPVPDCPYCGKPIKDISSAISDKNSGEPVHFDCVMARIAESEVLEQGDTVTYIGGGRFGVVRFKNPQNLQDFEIKKIFEWEDKENRAEWRRSISDYYSVT